ncbi:nicotinate-nucleotide adenylyltransferase [Candidatus Profftia tarda]|uniref:Probable nicotinate-nucleotide adenylyltransferase n=1 Tax=Candidatus Profftia tarda TaxID=1177216 RepID=A0A8E4F1I6_9ENTR|nr:nicotinate-nucleotide adenylyltransferase [Candidatus Profftia tarda]CAD6510986.1 Probable nicotinate-nucleotide adenylyltransferase [Candidatus Profftia tarda]
MRYQSSNNIQIIALFGGTFDPIHYGHLQTVAAIAKEIELHKVTLMPSNIPPHRPKPEANAQQRLKMIELAIEGDLLFSIDTRELNRLTPSYTTDTLKEIRLELGKNTPIAFIIGQDSLLTLDKWHRWKEILDYCHLLVCPRSTYSTSAKMPELREWSDTHCIFDNKLLRQQSHGYIYLSNTPLSPISGTDIRQRCRKCMSCDNLLPHTVKQYIELNALYR